MRQTAASETPDAAPGGAPTEHTKDDHVPVTVALAQAGYLFSMYHNDRLGVFWELQFEMKDEAQIIVELQSHGTWLTFIGDPGVGKPNHALASSLLGLNGRIAGARAGTNSGGEVIVISHFERSVLSSQQIKSHLNEVLTRVTEVRRAARPDLVSTEASDQSGSP